MAGRDSDIADDYKFMGEVEMSAANMNPRFKTPLNVRDLANNKATRFEIDSTEISHLFEDEEDESHLDEDIDEDEESSQEAIVRLRARKKHNNSKKANFEVDLSFECFSDPEQMHNIEDLFQDGSIKKMIVVPGGGIQVPDNCKAFVHYVCVGDGMTEPYDSTVSRGYPHCVDFRNTDVIPGLYLAIKSMRVNEVSKFWIRYDFAFGENGCPPRIPKRTDVCCVVELLDIIEEEKLKQIAFMSNYEREELEFSEIHSAAKELRTEGNGLYQSCAYWKAIKKYRKAAQILEEYPVIGSQDESERQALLYTLYVNLAQCYLKVNRPQQACIACHYGFRNKEHLDDTSAKIFHRFAEAKFMLGHTDDALKHCNEALRRQPKDAGIIAQKEKILQRKKYEDDAVKSTYTKMGNLFKSSTNGSAQKSEAKDSNIKPATDTKKGAKKIAVPKKTEPIAAKSIQENKDVIKVNPLPEIKTEKDFEKEDSPPIDWDDSQAEAFEKENNQLKTSARDGGGDFNSTGSGTGGGKYQEGHRGVIVTKTSSLYDIIQPKLVEKAKTKVEPDASMKKKVDFPSTSKSQEEQKEEILSSSSFENVLRDTTKEQQNGNNDQQPVEQKLKRTKRVSVFEKLSKEIEETERQKK